MALFISFGIYHCLTSLDGLEGITFYVLVDEIYILTDSSLDLCHLGPRSPNFTVVEVDGTVFVCRSLDMNLDTLAVAVSTSFPLLTSYTQIYTKSIPEHSHYLHTR